jgi:hypothetical protein
MGKKSKGRWSDRTARLTVDICAVGIVLFLLVSLCIFGLWLSRPYPALDWLLALPTALMFFTFALALFFVCVWIDAQISAPGCDAADRDIEQQLVDRSPTSPPHT